MSNVPVRVKDITLTLAVLVISWFALWSWWGVTAHAAYQLEYAPGVQHGKGIPSLSAPALVDVIGLRTAPQPALPPLRTSGVSQPVRVQITAPVNNEGFWRALSNCESPNGSSGRYIGYFQFSRDTAAKVGIDGSESYEEQRAAAESWSHQVSPGTTAGWPVCWWRALRNS